MLRLMRKYQRSFLIYVFFGIIIAVFVVNFGPQSAGCTAGTSYAGKVAGRGITMADFNYAQSIWGMKQQQGTEEHMVQLRAMVMDQLVARELMADDALAMGFEIPPEEIENMIFQGRYLALGEPRPLVRGDDGEFDYDRFSRYARYYWGVTPRRFKEQQQRELLADKLRQLLRTTVKVSDDEVEADYRHRGTQVKLSYVRFAPADFQAKVAVEPKALAAFTASNKDKIKEHYENNQGSFSKLPRQLKLQLIAVDWEGGQRAKTRAGTRASELHRRIAAGEEFGEVAAEASDDDSKSSQGTIGWREAANPGLGSQVTGALRRLKPGQVTGVIETGDRFLIVKVLGERQGDLTLAQAEEDIARTLFVDSETVTAARSAAAAFIARVKAGQKLEDLFTVDEGEGDASIAGDELDEDGAGKDATSDTKASKVTRAKKGEDKAAEAQPDRSPLKLARTEFFPRSPQDLVPRIGISKEVSEAAFKLKKGQVADRPIVVGQTVYLIAVDDRKEPDLEQLDKERENLRENFVMRKWAMRVRNYAHERCLAAAKNNEISISRSALITPGYAEGMRKQGKASELPPYTPCATLAQRSQPVF